MIVGQETISIKAFNVTITVVETTNAVNPYYASSSYKSIDGAGNTIQEAKDRCIIATRIQIDYDLK